MRINLTDDKAGRGGRRGRRRRGRRRSQTFDAAISLPQASSRAHPARKARAGRGPGKKEKPAEQAQARPSRARRSAQTERDAPSPRLRAIRWRSVFLRVPVAVIMIVLVGVSVYSVTDAQFFVYEASITGMRHLGAQVIYQAAGVHEQNIFWIDPQKVADRIMQLDGVKAVRVRCELPALVSIEVEEREPVLMWRSMTQQEDLWLDEEGVVLPYHGDVDAPDMIFVVAYGEQILETGDRIEPEGMARSVLELAATVPGIRVFTYQPGQGLSFTQGANGGEWPVYVGTSKDLPRKIQVLQSLTSYLQDHQVRPRYVDVRWADHPVYGRLAGEAVDGGE